MIYFVQPVGGGPVKIGTTENLEARMASLKGTYGCSLAVLATLPGSYEEERAWHKRFAHLRFGRSEQFRPAADLMEAIGRPLLVGVNPEAIEAISSGTKAVRLDLPPDTHRLLRKLSAEDETSMSAYAGGMLERHIREEASRRGIT